MVLLLYAIIPCLQIPAIYTPYFSAFFTTCFTGFSLYVRYIVPSLYVMCAPLLRIHMHLFLRRRNHLILHE